MRHLHKLFTLILLVLCSCGKESGEFDNPTEPAEKEPTVFGRVRDYEGKPLEGVVVSDGLTSVKTDGEGRYAIASDLTKTRFIFVSQPSGYRASTVNGLPAFYKELGKGDVQPINGVYHDVDFNLQKIESNPDSYTILMTADPQSRPRGRASDKIAYHSLDCQADMFRDLKEYSSSLSGTNVCGIVLGDIVHESMDLYDDFADGLKGLNYPTYAVIGNHDNDTAAADDDSGAACFEKYFGPRNYSFNLGKVHVVVLDNLIMDSDDSGLLKSYGQGLTDDVWGWLQSDLKFVDRSSTVMVCSHSPMFRMAEDYDRYDSRNTRHGYDYANLFGSFRKVYAWAGHVHNMFNYIPVSSSITANVETHTLSRTTGDLWTNEWLNGDGTPRGYLAVRIDGEDVSWQFRPVAYQSNPVNNAALPEYGYRTVEDNVVYADGERMGASYQMRAYPRGTYGDNYVYVNVFMWDSEWQYPQYVDSDGNRTEMKPVTDSRFKFDAAAFGIYEYFKNNQTLKNNGYDYDKNVRHLFRCYSAKKSDSGTVTVTDRFGNTYATGVSW